MAAAWRAAVALLAMALARAAAESASAAAAKVARTDLKAIPQWKIDMTLAPGTLIPPQGSVGAPGAFQMPFQLPTDTEYGYKGNYNDGVQVGYGGGDQEHGALYAPFSSAGGAYGGVAMMANKAPVATPQPYSSTEGQDEQICPILKLPDYMVLQTTSSSSSGAKGNWKTDGYIALVNWVQNFWGRSWSAIYMKTVDGQLAGKAVPLTEQQLYDLYGWKAHAKAYPNLTALDALQVLAVEMNESNTVTYALTDCQDNLMFVAHLQKGLPGVTDIYDRLGWLVAHTVSDPTILRHQFVDTNGYLLAIAESPGLLLNVTRPLPPLPSHRSDIMPYALQFSIGGYEGYSKLLDTDFHWVIAATVQVRAMVDAYGTWRPNLSTAAVIMAVGGVLLSLLLLGFIMWSFYRMVYPDMGDWRTRMNPFIFADKQRLYNTM